MIELIVLVIFMFLTILALKEVIAMMKKQLDYSRDMNKLLYEILNELKTKDQKENGKNLKDEAATLELSGKKPE